MSLTSNISKVLKKLIHKCLYHFLGQNEILYNNQYGFRNNHSAIDVLIDITEKIRNALDYKYYAFNIFIDLEKVFDTVNRTMGNVMFFFFVAGNYCKNLVDRTAYNKRVHFFSIIYTKTIGLFLVVFNINT